MEGVWLGEQGPKAIGALSFLAACFTLASIEMLKQASGFDHNNEDKDHHRLVVVTEA